MNNAVYAVTVMTTNGEFHVKQEPALVIKLPADHPYVTGFSAWKIRTRDGWRVKWRNFQTEKCDNDHDTEQAADEQIAALEVSCRYVDLWNFEGHDFSDLQQFWGVDTESTMQALAWQIFLYDVLRAQSEYWAKLEDDRR